MYFCFFSAAVVLLALRSPHAKANSGVLAAGLGAIARLAAGQAANRVELGHLGACAGACLAGMLRFVPVRKVDLQRGMYISKLFTSRLKI